ncbi:MAG TPA: NADP-dependent oxidoreductase [Candidatus Angelobacter sp.]|jgi:NADPH:quinone reductase-like Zn-dependent oxidoreductase|nr:NADP-dependent oxidoreductase [Candidatus Angelobacter sp.]
MKAARILKFGSPDTILTSDIDRPEAADDQVLVRVMAAGVGPWDALIREGKSVLPQPLPLTLGSDLSGVIEAVGPAVSGFQVGDEVYGVTNKQFTGAYAEYALAAAGMIARKPGNLSFVQAASAPVVAVTAWQMLFDYARLTAGQVVLVHGAAGNVGGYAVQLANSSGLHVIALSAGRDMDYVRSLGAETIVNYEDVKFENVVSGVDAVMDTVGGETTERSFAVLKPGGILVSVAVSSETPISQEAAHHGVRAVSFLAEVTTARLNTITSLFESGKLLPQVGTVLSLDQARSAHEMLAGAPHKRGKIVLQVAA